MANRLWSIVSDRISGYGLQILGVLSLTAIVNASVIFEFINKNFINNEIVFESFLNYSAAEDGIIMVLRAYNATQRAIIFDRDLNCVGVSYDEGIDPELIKEFSADVRNHVLSYPDDMLRTYSELTLAGPVEKIYWSLFNGNGGMIASPAADFNADYIGDFFCVEGSDVDANGMVSQTFCTRKEEIVACTLSYKIGGSEKSLTKIVPVLSY